MPIEIRELVIRATVEQNSGEAESQALYQSNTTDRPNNELIDRMDQLKKIMQEKNER